MGVPNPGYYLRVRRERARLILRFLRSLSFSRRPGHAARTHLAVHRARRVEVA